MTRSFAHASPRILAAIVLAAAAARIAIGDFSPYDLVPAAVLLAFWPFQEWLIHVYILHYKPVRFAGRTWDFSVPRKHRAHHADPWRLDLLFIPEHVFLYGLPFHGLLWFGLMPTPAIACSGFLAYFVLALHYEWVHYLAHVHYQPGLAHYQRLAKSHRRHHFKNEHYWYGVTMLSGDRVLGTRPDADAVPTSDTARSLLGSEPRPA